MSGPRRALVLAAALLGALPPPTAGAAAQVPASASAPGVVVVALGGGAVATREPADGAAVALPDGGAVAVVGGFPGPAGFDAVQLNADGTLDTSFGTDGIAHVPVDRQRFGQIEQIVRQPDGALVVVGRGPAADSSELGGLVLVGLNADGSLDQSFGDGGVDRLPIQASCGGCDALALRAGGGLVVTGRTGRASPTPTGMATTHWVLAGLTSTGALDQTFAQSGIATVPASAGYGLDVAELPDGDIVGLGGGAIGDDRFGQYLTRLLPSGALDASYDGAVPVALPDGTGVAMLAEPDGSVVLGGNGTLARYTASGVLDPSFGSGGIAPIDGAELRQLLPGHGGGLVAVLRSRSTSSPDVVDAITPSGALDTSLDGPAGLLLDLPFGGGSASPPAGAARGGLPPLAQNAFAGSLLQRPDGSYLALGPVSVSAPTTAADDHSLVDLGVAAFTQSFGPDASFGGPPTPLRAALTLVRQTAATALARNAVRVSIDVSAPGLARVLVTSDRRTIAESLLPVFAATPTTSAVELTRFGAQWLRGHPHGRLTAGLTARDMLTNVASAAAAGALG